MFKHILDNRIFSGVDARPVKRVKAEPLFPPLKSGVVRILSQGDRDFMDRQDRERLLAEKRTAPPMAKSDHHPLDADGLPIEIGKEYECLPDEVCSREWPSLSGTRGTLTVIGREPLEGLENVQIGGVWWATRSVRRVKSSIAPDCAFSVGLVSDSPKDAVEVKLKDRWAGVKWARLINTNPKEYTDYVHGAVFPLGVENIAGSQFAFCCAQQWPQDFEPWTPRVGDWVRRHGCLVEFYVAIESAGGCYISDEKGRTEGFVFSELLEPVCGKAPRKEA